MKIEGTTALVTGGASGLGAATVQRLAEQGAKVYAIDLADAIHGLVPVPGVTYLAADVTDESEVQHAVDRVSDSGTPLRIAVNCAGIAPSTRILSRQGRHPSPSFARVVAINLVGTFTVMTCAAEAMAQTEPDATGSRGVIVNTGSIAGYEGQIGQVAYAASKAGVIGLTLPAARDLAHHGIRVCTIAPGIVDTPMLQTVDEDIRTALAQSVPFPQRLSSPEEYAHLVTLILEHDYLNGETIRMDGALRMAPR